MFESRIQNVKAKLKKASLDGILISSVGNINYLTGYSNFSKDEREAYLIIGQDFQYIITDGRYAAAVKNLIPNFTLYERGHNNPTENLLKNLKKKVQNLGVEENNLTVSEHKFFRKYFRKIKDLDIKDHRSIKSPEEIKKIEAAAKLGDKAFEFILKKIKEGITEEELAFEIELYIKKNGATLSFPSIVAFGANSSVPHHQTGNTKLKKGDFVLLDFGVKFKNYCSDMTRTVFFGKVTDKQRKIYEMVLEAQERTVDFVNESIKKGKEVKAKDVDKVARQYIFSKGFPSIPHSLGHGIGLEVHESPHLSPKSKDILQEGMVFSIEPGIYLPAGRQGIPDFGGVRIEDLYVFEKKGLRQITNSPKEFIEV